MGNEFGFLYRNLISRTIVAPGHFQFAVRFYIIPLLLSVRISARGKRLTFFTAVSMLFGIAFRAILRIFDK